jgi:hypothetical protein
MSQEEVCKKMETDDMRWITSTLRDMHDKIDNIESSINSAQTKKYSEPEKVSEIWRSITSKAQ